MASALIDIHGRLVDLLPITQARATTPTPARKLGTKQRAAALVPTCAMKRSRRATAGWPWMLHLGHIPNHIGSWGAIHGELLAYCALDTLGDGGNMESPPQHESATTSTPSPTKELKPMPIQPEAPASLKFFADTIRHLMAGTMIPKVRSDDLARSSFFLPPVVVRQSAGRHRDVVPRNLSGRKATTNRQTSTGFVQPPSKNCCFVPELKTTDTSFAAWQASI